MSTDRVDLSVARAYMCEMEHIEGWLSLPCAYALYLLQSVQTKLGIRGDIFEIGVHHGKSALLLSCFIDPKHEWLRLNDIFEDQAANISHSGAGDRKVFLTNLARYRPGFHRYLIFQKPSDTLTLKETGQNCRIFHIDGGHSAKETEHDLRTATRAIHSRGVIIVDDYFNQDFPGVSEGVNRFLLAHEEIRPFLLCFNKMYLCHRKMLAVYRENIIDKNLLREFAFGHYIKEFYGEDVILLFDLPASPSARIRILLPETHLSCVPGETVTIDVTIENCGAGDILDIRGCDVKLDYHLYANGTLVSWDNRRVPLWPLRKGQQKTIACELVAPGAPGKYVFEFDGVIDGVTWLKDVGGETTQLHMVVLG